MTPHPKYPGPTMVPDRPPAYDSLPPPAAYNMPLPQACPPTAYSNAPPPAAYNMLPCPPTYNVPPSPVCPPPTRDGVPSPAYSPLMYEKPSHSAYHSPTQMPTLPVYPPFYSVMKNQNSYNSGQHFPWPYQLWRENSTPLLPPTYPGAPYPYYNPQYAQTTHHVTHSQMPQYIPSPPYHMTHPQSMPKTPQYFPPPHQWTNLYAHPRYTSPYPLSMPPTRPLSSKNKSYGFKSKSFVLNSKTSLCRENRSGEASESSSSSEDESSEQESNVSQELNEENSSGNLSDKESGSNSLGDPESEGKDEDVPQDNRDAKEPNEIRNCSGQNHSTASGSLLNENNNENICDKASESNNLKDAKSEEKDKNIQKQIKDTKGPGKSKDCVVKNHGTASETPSEDSSSDTINAKASESSNLKGAEIEKKIESISQETEDTEGPNEVKNCSAKNHGSTALESPVRSDCTKNTSRRKKKKQKNICDVKGEDSPISDVSHNLENEKEHHKLKGKKDLTC